MPGRHRRRTGPIEVWMIVKDADRIRRARKRAGYSQVDLARLVGVTQQYISTLETGADRDCSERVADKIVKYLPELEDVFEPGRSARVPAVTTPSRATRNAS